MKKLKSTLKNFLSTEATSGAFILIATLIAITAANSQYASYYHFFTKHATHWVNDILMMFFFLLVGLELKHETKNGVLKDKKSILFPFIAALGGIITPALIFLAITSNHPALHAGWAIPAATDIAFALGVLTLIGKHIPKSLKIFLLAIAIFDDIAAVIIISVFYTKGWALHPALIGCFIGLCISEKWIKKIIPILHPWVAFFIIPLFIFTNAGISLQGITQNDVINHLTIAILLALFLGKQIGIFISTWIMVKAGWAQVPEGANWKQIYGIAILGGIGFTMSLFIGCLAFPHGFQNAIKIGVIGGSLCSIIWGSIVLRPKLVPRP
jgi:NhaA family Na+:H+ antiporter